LANVGSTSEQVRRSVAEFELKTELVKSSIMATDYPW